MGFFKKIAKIAKKVAKVALPAAAAFVPGIGPLGAAALGAAGGAIGGGGLKGALLGGVLGGGGSLLSGGLSGDGILGFKAGTALDKVSGIAGMQGPTRGSGFLGAVTKNIPGLSGSGTSLMKTAGDVFSGVQGMSTQDKMKKQLLESQGRVEAALSPYTKSGAAANSMLTQKLQSGELGGTFTPEDLQNDPGYQFQLQQGNDAIQKSLAAQGGLFSGRAGKELAQYSQGLADQTYNNAFNRDLQSQGLTYGMLSDQSGQGLNAAGAMGGVYDTIGNINANTTLRKSNVLNSTLARILSGSGAKQYAGMDQYGQPIYL